MKLLAALATCALITLAFATEANSKPLIIEDSATWTEQSLFRKVEFVVFYLRKQLERGKFVA